MLAKLSVRAFDYEQFDSGPLRCGYHGICPLMWTFLLKLLGVLGNLVGMESDDQQVMALVSGGFLSSQNRPCILGYELSQTGYPL